MQGCSGSSCTERKQGSLHRGVLFDFIVNVLNPICYPPNTLNATSRIFQQPQLCQKALATIACRDKAHLATYEGGVLLVSAQSAVLHCNHHPGTAPFFPFPQSTHFKLRKAAASEAIQEQNTLQLFVLYLYGNSIIKHWILCHTHAKFNNC